MTKLSKSQHLIRSGFLLSHMAKAAYEPNPRKVPAIKDYGWKSIRTFNDSDTDTQGFVTGDDDNLVVCFRGTESAQDWITDLKTTHHNDNALRGKIHHGFWEAWKGIREDVLGIVDELHKKKQNIWVTGHSLGGALAVICGRALPKKHLPTAIHTFGAPRVGNPSFADNYDRTLHQFVNEDDIVPHVPTRGLLTQYRHVGKTHVMLPGGKISSTKASWSATLAKVSKVMIFGVGSLTKKSISDHSMNRYITKFKAHKLIKK